jgi:hypothetical protein
MQGVKMNCYNCKHHGEVAGSAHSSCKVLDKHPDLMIQCFIAATTLGKVGDFVKLHPHGVKNGWACWPLNFDPCWVEECKFYKEKE